MYADRDALRIAHDQRRLGGHPQTADGVHGVRPRHLGAEQEGQAHSAPCPSRAPSFQFEERAKALHVQRVLRRAGLHPGLDLPPEQEQRPFRQHAKDHQM